MTTRPERDAAEARANDADSKQEPAAARARRVGLYGGSFDPVHVGHMHVARSARQHAALDELLFVPARRPPHKPGRRLASGEHRMAMLELALEGLGFGLVTDLELRRSGPSYTIDTVRALSGEAPGAAPGLVEQLAGARLVLILGSDNLAGLPEWREVEELLTRVDPIVIARGERHEEWLAGLRGRLPEALIERLAAGFLDLPPVPISSTALRAALARGEDPGDELPRGVLEYARRHGVYAPQASSQTSEVSSGGPASPDEAT